MKNKKVLCIIITTITILAIGTIIWFLFIKNNDKKATEIKAIDNIEKYGYVLYENRTELYKNKFNELKDTLNKEELDEKKYAELIAELFVIDFYTLDNKVTNTDIGGVDFIHPNGRENFMLKATDTIYKYIESNVYNERNQELPTVSNVIVKTNEQKEYETKNVKDKNSYVINLDIEYEKDLEYPTNVTVILVHDENKLYVVEVK